MDQNKSNELIELSAAELKLVHGGATDEGPQYRDVPDGPDYAVPEGPQYGP